MVINYVKYTVLTELFCESINKVPQFFKRENSFFHILYLKKTIQNFMQPIEVQK